MELAIIGQEKPKVEEEATVEEKKTCGCKHNKATVNNVFVVDFFRLFLLFVLVRISVELIKKYL